MSDHFFSRWSRRKQGLDTQEPLAKPSSGQPSSTTAVPRALDAAKGLPPNPPHTSKLGLQGGPSGPAGGVGRAAVSGGAAPVGNAADPALASPEPVPTLEDVERLTPASDFQNYMRQGVPGEVRNAAMKKLFTDPHFNVMDGLDIYIGDYNTPDPLPAGMLQKMVGAELLNLFPKTQENPDHRAPASEPAAFVAKSPNSQVTPDLQADTTAQHDHPDLQLQPNHAPASPDTGPSTG